MPEKSYFFTAVETSPGIYDRVYTAAEYADYFAQFLTNGIYNGGTNLQVSATGPDMKTAIAPGYAWINGYMYKVHTSPVSVTHDTADAMYNRIDRVVARWDSDARAIMAAIVKGTPAESPVAPDITRNDEIYELSLAQVLIPAASSVIPPGSVTDERLDEEVCGLVNSLIKVETVQFQNQWNAWFNTNSAAFEQAWDDWFSQQQTEGFVMAANIDQPVSGGVVGIGNYLRAPGYGAATGSANTYEVTLNPAPEAYVEGLPIAVKINVDNTGASTLNVNGLGAVPIVKTNGDPVEQVNLLAGRVYSLRYDGANFQLQGEGGGLPQIFGEGSDGVLNSTGNVTITTSLNTGIAIKQYDSFVLNEGHTLTVSQPCRGLIIFCKKDFTINGTISMSEKGGISQLNAKKLPFVASVIADRLGDSYCFGGNGGNGGREVASANFAYGHGGRLLAGGFGGSGAGGLCDYGTGCQGGNASDIVINGWRPPEYPYAGYGGAGGYENVGSPGTNGGAGGGGGIYTGSNGGVGGARCGAGGGGGGAGSSVYASPGVGQAGETGGYVGGYIAIICGGTVRIGSTGQLLAKGANGGKGGDHGVAGRGGGGGGGAGGGVVHIVYANGFENLGAINVDGGLAGAMGAGGTIGTAATAGLVGSIATLQLPY